jgi:3-hydroxybenzoate 6-monooxygenase
LSRAINHNLGFFSTPHGDIAIVKPIVIAGAGIGGLSAAVALARHGLAVRIYERVAQLREFGAGIQLGPNAFRMFKRHGVQDAMEEIAFSHVRSS